MEISQQKKDLFFTSLNQLWRLVSGPITMFLIPIFLSQEEQGYWYLFGSVSALSVLADLGFSNIILQFSAHEFAHLSYAIEGRLIGEEYHIKKISSFFMFTLRWAGLICAIAYPAIFIVGLWFLHRDEALDTYFVPWMVFSVGSLIFFFSNMLLSFIEGLNKIEIIQGIRLKVAIINTIVISILLITGGNLYALAFGQLLSSLFIPFYLLKRFHVLFCQLFFFSKKIIYNWRKEVFSLFSRYSLSFMSGYFIFNIYTPLMQYFYGPIESGKVGISLALVTSIFSISNIWIYTITPKMNMLVSQNNKNDLDALFNKRLVYSLITYVFISLCLFFLVTFFQNFEFFSKIAARFLSFKTIFVILLCYFFQLMINSWATYLRAHKKEPYMYPSIASAIWITIGTIIVGHYFKSEYFFIGFLSSYIWWLPLAYFMYISSQKKWYGKV